MMPPMMSLPPPSGLAFTPSLLKTVSASGTVVGSYSSKLFIWVLPHLLQRRHQLLAGDRHIVHPHPDRVVDGGGDGGAGWRHRRLADSVGAVGTVLLRLLD